MKFKKGDIIKGICGNGYLFTNEKMTRAKVVDTFVEENIDFMKIIILEYPRERMLNISFIVRNDDKLFKIVEKKDQECIVIYINGNNVIALNKSTKEKAVARCSPDDEFDFKIGSTIAFNRLIEKEITNECRSYSAKIVCTSVSDMMKKYYTVGKVYTVNNGFFKDDCGNLTLCRSIDEINKNSSTSKFIELIGE